jgi:hypothetical protein
MQPDLRPTVAPVTGTRGVPTAAQSQTGTKTAAVRLLTEATGLEPATSGVTAGRQASETRK